MSKKPFSDHNLELGEEAVNHIIALLEKNGYKIKRNELSREFSRSILPPNQSAELHTFPGLAFDLFIGSKGKETAYLAQIKGKSFDGYKYIVNRDLYDGYYAIARLPFPFLYFVWIRENDKIYRHEITNPENFETGISSDGTPTYLMPDDSIHEAQLNEDILLSCCMSEEALMERLNKMSKKSYYEKNKERLSIKHKEYYEKNKERISAQKKEYYTKNKEQISARKKRDTLDR